MFECGTASSAAQFEKSNKAVIEHIRRDGSKELILIAEALETGVAPTIPIPPRPPQIPDPQGGPGAMMDDEAERLIWQGVLKLVPSRRKDLEEGLVSVFAKYYDQCSLTVRGKLEQLDDWPDIKRDKDVLRLKAEIRNIMCGRESHREPVYSMVQLIKILVNLVQKPDQSNERYKETFEGLWDALVQQGGDISHHPGLIATEALTIAAENGRNAPNADDTAEATDRISNKIKACFMLSGADDERHGDLKKSCENAFTMGRDEFPENTTQLLSKLNNWRPIGGGQRPQQRNNPRPQPNVPDEDGLNFMQQEDDGEVGAQMFIGSDGGFDEEDIVQEAPSRRRRRRRNNRSHRASAGARTESTAAGVNEGDANPPAEDHTPPCVHCGSNGAYLTDIHTVDTPLTMHTNAGSSISTKKGRLGSMLFWLNPGGLASVVSLKTFS